MKKYLFYLLSIIISCTNSSVNKDNTHPNSMKHDSNTKILDYNTTSGNADTSLAVFLYKNKESYKFEEFFFEYQRLEMEKTKIIPLVASLFPNDSIALIKIDRIRLQFLKEAEKNALNKVKDGVLDDMLLDFLADAKHGNTLKSALEKFLKNKKNDTTDMQYAKEVLSKLKENSSRSQ